MSEWLDFDYDLSYRNGVKKPIDILIGCPVHEREWIMDDWFWRVNAACKVAGLHPGYIFVMDPTEEPLYTMIQNQAKLMSTQLHIGVVQEQPRDDKRDWNERRYDRMVELRNILLEGVRANNPPLFLSLDSDILLHEEAIKSMVDNLEDFDAIGGKTYMTHTGTTCLSYGIMKPNTRMMRRADAIGSFKVDVIMAIKLMTPAAYNIDYRFDSQGEDIGFSRACQEAGLKLKWDGTYANKHVMRRADLGRIDPRCGF